jgi:hypothetical protein
VVAAAAVAVLAGTGLAKTSGGPFPIAPSRTQECHNLAYCFGVAGLWVVIPAHGQATYLFACPQRSEIKGQFLLGGTDALASSPTVRVWYEGKLGAPIGAQSPGAGLLFHAVTLNAKQESFRPILGCISLSQAVKRSTVSARAATATPTAPHSAPPAHPRATNLILAPGNVQPAAVNCLPSETLAGSWSAVAYGTSGPPKLPPANAVKIVTRELGRTVQATIRAASSVPYLVHVQIGALCEPTS